MADNQQEILKNTLQDMLGIPMLIKTLSSVFTQPGAQEFISKSIANGFKSFVMDMEVRKSLLEFVTNKENLNKISEIFVQPNLQGSIATSVFEAVKRLISDEQAQKGFAAIGEKLVKSEALGSVINTCLMQVLSKSLEGADAKFQAVVDQMVAAVQENFNLSIQEVGEVLKGLSFTGELKVKVPTPQNKTGPISKP